jgi:phospholipid/cholesterol/gamma-HCH transport system substrate-binding protein
MKIGASLTKLAIFAFITLFSTAILVQTIGNIQFSSESKYKAIFTDVTGLLSNTDVRIAGVKVGEIKSIDIYNQKLAMVGFTVRKNIKIPRASTVQIKYANLVGGRFLSLTEGPGTEMQKENGIFPVSQTKPALDLTVLLNGFKPLFQALNPADVNRLAFEIIQTLQGEGGTLNDLLIHTASLTGTLADRDALIGNVITNLNTVLATVDARDNELDQTIVQLQRLFSGLAQDRQAIGDSLVNIDLLAGDVASLLSDLRPVLKPDVDHLNSIVGELAKPDELKGLAKQVQDLPNRVNTVTRTATYGSWFNFFLCKADGQVSINDPVTGQPTPLSTVAIKNNDPVCTS